MLDATIRVESPRPNKLLHFLSCAFALPLQVAQSVSTGAGGVGNEVARNLVELLTGGEAEQARSRRAWAAAAQDQPPQGASHTHALVRRVGYIY